jgi:HEAT repeat protein
MEKFIEITEDDLAEISEPIRRRVADTFNQFMKTVKARLVYPASSRLPQQFKEELFAGLSSLLDELDEIAFKVDADSVMYNDREVYKAKGKAENFAHPFFRDGILEFRFKSGITIEELGEFVEITSRMMRSALVDDDLASLLWEAGFEHISYELMDDFLDLETFEYGTDNIKTGKSPSKDDMSRLYENEIDIGFTDEDFNLDSEKSESKETRGAYGNAEDQVAEFIRNIAEYDDKDKAAIAEVLSAEASFDFTKYAVNISFEILGLETDNAGYDESLDLIAKVGNDFIKAGDFKSAVTVLERTRELEQVFKNLGDPKRDRISKFIERFAASERIRDIVEVLNKSNDVVYSEVTDYLKMLPWQAIDPLIWALGELHHYPARRAVCQALEVLGADQVDFLGKGTENPRWYVVRNIVSILGKIEDPRALNYLKRTIRHSDSRVRKETIISAARIYTSEAADFLVGALNDEDERLQTMALREIVRKKTEQAFNAIGKIIGQKNFKNRSTEQIREFLEGFAILGGKNAFEPLRRIIQRRVLLASEKDKRLKDYAVRALGNVNVAEARQLLEKISRSRNRALADTARRTINRKLKGDSLV